jgi:S1-C subfamily serine protease
LQFTSSQNYQIAELGNSAVIKTGINVYATGFPLPGPGTPKRSYRFLPGLISGRNPEAKNGYELTYTIELIPGMSGGPIFNEQGQVVGIYGEGDRDIRTGRASLGLGIPINIAFTQLKTPPKPVNPNNSSSNFVLAKTLKGHSNSVLSVAFSPDGKTLASGSGRGDRTIIIWNVATGQEISRKVYGSVANGLSCLTTHSGLFGRCVSSAMKVVPKPPCPNCLIIW